MAAENRIRILIADNNVELCETLKDYFAQQEGLEVVAIAYDGEQALRSIAEHEPDVVVLDVTMPHLDGLAVLERLDELNLSMRPNIIVLTALSREDVVQRFTDLGAQYFIVKPFDLDSLADRVRQFGGGGPAASTVKETRKSYRAPSPKPVEATVTQLLHKMGVPPHFKGHKYLRDAVTMVLQEEDLLGGSLTKRLYPALAERYGATPGGVEAAIRNAIIACWENGNREFLYALAGSNARRDKFPTNSMMIAKIADHIKLGRMVS